MSNVAYRRLTIPLALAGAIALAGCRKPDTAVQAAKPADPPPVQANLVRVTPQPFAALVSVTGTLVSTSRVEVKAETTGRITRFDKQEGEPVRAGEAVLFVDQENYKLAVRQAESAVEVASASLDRAKVLAEHSRNELDRAQNLIRSGGITEKDLKLAQVNDKDTRAQVALAQAQLDQARTSLDVANKHLRDTVVKAPVDGEIQRKHINPGAYVEPATPVFTLVDNRRLELESSVPSSELGPVRPGQRVTFFINAYPGETFEGRVVELSPSVDAESRAAKVRIAVNNPGLRLKAGMFAEGQIATGAVRQAILVPIGAVRRDDRSSKDSMVFVVDNGKAVKRAVRLGAERDSSIEIVDGLKPGEMLVAEQNIEIAEGVRVRERDRVSQ